ncbi:DMT family transporter [Reinekea sp.]|jgi:drug/metabolite transporter (DMT)-like permease|uniref:DMT family transporter n=1 Tax=Reinekea sp. TaxID=1970455 RepID=UPI002A801F62|nr:DMT family transporter [Reinekea sp.]
MLSILTADSALRAPLGQVHALAETSATRRQGLLAAGLTVLIWSIYFLSLQLGMRSALTLFDLALLRYAVPGVLLLPWLIRRWPTISQVPILYRLGMIGGAGLPFFLLSGEGMALSQVAVASTLIPGMAPIFISTLAVLFFRQGVTRTRRIGLAIIATGVLLLLGQAWLGPASLGVRGPLLLIGASFCWALFTVSVRQSGLTALEAAAVVVVPNGALALALAWTAEVPFAFGGLPGWALASQLVVQGLVVGLGSSLAYGYAITRLGAELTSTIGALTPVVAGSLALLLLRETATGVMLMGMTLVVIGVIGASGWLTRPHR